MYITLRILSNLQVPVPHIDRTLTSSPLLDTIVGYGIDYRVTKPRIWLSVILNFVGIIWRHLKCLTRSPKLERRFEFNIQQGICDWNCRSQDNDGFGHQAIPRATEDILHPSHIYSNSHQTYLWRIWMIAEGYRNNLFDYIYILHWWLNKLTIENRAHHMYIIRLMANPLVISPTYICMYIYIHMHNYLYYSWRLIYIYIYIYTINPLR